MSPKPLVLLVLSVLWVSALPLPAATVPLQNAALSGSTTLSGTLTSGSAATVDLRLGNILLPASATASNALTSGTISGNSIISSGTLSIGAATFISGTASTVDLRLGNILLPASATSGTSTFSGSNAVLSGTSSLASGTFTIASGATFLSAASSSVDLRLGTVQLPSAVSLLGQSIDLATEVSGTLQSANFPSTLPAVNGSALTNLSASAISSGTVAAARLPVMIGDTGTGGTSGLVPAPASGDATKVLYGNGQWATPPGAAGGEANTASNLGTSSDGEGLFSAKSGTDLQFKRIKAGTNITLSTSGSSVTINSTATSGTGGSGSTSDSPDNFPSSPSAWDDEFTSGISAQYTWWPASSSTSAIISATNGKMFFSIPPSIAMAGPRVMFRSSPSVPFTVTAKVNLTDTTGYDQSAGIVIGNSSNGSSRFVSINRVSSTWYISSVNRTDNFLNYANAVDTNKGLTTAYLRIKYDGTNIITYYSPDGAYWVQHTTQTLATYVGTVDRLGFCSSLGNTSGSGYSVFGFDFIRVTTP